MKRKSISSYILWTIFALPAFMMLFGLLFGSAEPDGLLHPSGEFAARFMIIAMMITPLRMLFPNVRWLVWLMRRRRYLGVAAFGYATLHTLLYIVDMGALKPMVDEFWALGIWTGWAAFVIFIPLALTSNDASQRRLNTLWKRLQRFVYPAAILALLHWIFVHNNLTSALIHFMPLAALEVWRVYKSFIVKYQQAPAKA